MLLPSFQLPIEVPQQFATDAIVDVPGSTETSLMVDVEEIEVFDVKHFFIYCITEFNSYVLDLNVECYFL